MTPLEWDGDRAPLAKALVAAQKATESVKKAATNPAFKSKYADLSHVVEGVIPALNAAGVGVIQSPSYDGEMVSVTTTLLHESGSSVTGTLSMRPSKPDPQGVGSAITYARRYALLAMTGAAPEDDDGNAASQPTRKTPDLSVAPEGNDWWGCAGDGLSAYAAKQKGLDKDHDEMRQAIAALSSAEEWREWCKTHAEAIGKLPKSWRIILRQDAEAIAAELGVDLNSRTKAA
jgi:hypothetical protein